MPGDQAKDGSDHPSSWMRDEFPLWIGGKHRRSASVRAIRSPYDDRLVASICIADKAEALAAVDAAIQAAPAMRSLTRYERADILRRAATLLQERRKLFADTITAESAKPLRESLIETDRGVSTLQFSADEALRLNGEMVPMDAAPGGRGYLGFTVREPVGVVAAITPFNFPLNLALHKIAPALAAGNSVVHKPASTTPVTAMLLARLMHEAGLPAGALNTIPGPGSLVGDTLTGHPGVAMITFTGSTEVGTRIRQRAGLKRVTLELGSNSAVIVLPDADIPSAVRRCVAGAYAHSGQVCISVQRIFVHEVCFGEFAREFAEAAANLKQGAPESPETELSCLIDKAEAERVAEWIAEARVQGAVPLAGGGIADGTKLAANVLTRVPPGSKLMRCEAFGPVACINPVASLDEGIAAVNASEYGLQAGIFTQHAASAWQAAREIHTGAVLINETPQFRVDQMPYGGVKQSGTGREGPRYAIDEMTESKLIVWKL